MPKRIMVFIAIAIVSAAALLLAGCGSGDKGPVGRASINDLLSVGSGTGGTGGGGGGGGGGGATGACVLAGSSCVSNIDQGTCQQAAQQAQMQGDWTAGATCQSLGFTNCQTQQGVEICF